MKSLLLLSAILILGGCADAQKRKRAEQEDAIVGMVANEPSEMLCAIILVRPDYQELAEEEIARRGFKCDWVKAQALAQIYLEKLHATEQSIGQP